MSTAEDTVVEAVAEAICQGPDTSWTWAARTELSKERFRAKARRGIAAARLTRAGWKTPEEIAIQRTKEWTDFHPEDYCHICGRPNIIWYVASSLWNQAFPEVVTIACPQCFVAAFNAATGLNLVWQLSPDPALHPEKEGQ